MTDVEALILALIPISFLGAVFAFIISVMKKFYSGMNEEEEESVDVKSLVKDARMALEWNEDGMPDLIKARDLLDRALEEL